MIDCFRLHLRHGTQQLEFPTSNEKLNKVAIFLFTELLFE